MAKNKAKTDGEVEKGQGRLEGMPEPEKPDPLYKYTRTFKAVRVVHRTTEEAIETGRLEIPLYSETISRVQERDENAKCLSQAQISAVAYLDEHVQTLEEFHAEVGGILSKVTSSCEKQKPSQKTRQKSN